MCLDKVFSVFYNQKVNLHFVHNQVIAMKKTRDILTTPASCIFFFISAFLIGIILPFCWGNNPGDTYGTLSILCEDRKPWFWLWTVLTGGCFYCNLNRMFIRYKNDKLIFRISVFVMLVGMLITALTLKHSVQTMNAKRIIHWAGAIMYAAFALLSNFLFYLSMLKKDRRFSVPFILICSLVLLMIVWLFVIGRSGYMEFIPIAITEIMMFTVAVTGAIKPKQPG